MTSPVGTHEFLVDPLDSAHLVPNLVAQRAFDAADTVFLIDTENGSATYRQFHDLARRWSGVLRELEVRSGDRVAVMLPTSITEHATWIACGFERVLQVPINTAYRGTMLAHVLSDAGSTIAIATPEFARLIDEVRDKTSVSTIVVVDGVTSAPHHRSADDLLDAAVAVEDSPPIEAADIAAVIYTSGTTGPSKGVLVPWGELATGLSAFDDMGEGDVLYAPFAAYHLGGKLPLQLLAYWTGTFVFRDGFRTSCFWDDVRAHGCNRAWLFHAMANFVYRQPPCDDDLDNPLQTVSGGPMLAAFRDFERRFGVRMRTNYGSTELGWPICTGDDVADHLSCGRARPGYDLQLVDDSGHPVGEDQVGELLVRPHLPSIMNVGYLGRPEATEMAWRDGWFHTGDAFRVDAAGCWYFVDRVKDAIRRRGENVSSFEVESMLAAHPDVIEVAVVGVPSTDGEEEIKACVVRLPNSDLTAADLIDTVAPTMPRFMVPRYVEFVDHLPKTPTSKVRKVELKVDPLNERTWDRQAAVSP
jgi:crotonobetaine/carnitine-CoA ligase